LLVSQEFLLSSVIRTLVNGAFMFAITVGIQTLTF